MFQYYIANGYLMLWTPTVLKELQKVYNKAGTLEEDPGNS
jgi:hypothetical protein